MDSQLQSERKMRSMRVKKGTCKSLHRRWGLLFPTRRGTRRKWDAMIPAHVEAPENIRNVAVLTSIRTNSIDSLHVVSPKYLAISTSNSNE
eukprot:m.92996 g.92996  ORF g.92996 m.92996 type:complete len:91 (+) comp12378_c0_seq2:1174-1446(+)